MTAAMSGGDNPFFLICLYAEFPASKSRFRDISLSLQHKTKRQKVSCTCDLIILIGEPSFYQASKNSVTHIPHSSLFSRPHFCHNASFRHHPVIAKEREAAKTKIPDEQYQVMLRATDNLAKSGIIESALKEGDRAPEFVLPNAIGAQVSLSGLLQKGPVVLSFYRGGW
jgi:hypothetical protein